LPFKVVRTNGHDEIVARTNNLLVGRAAFETARRLYPHERVDYRDGARIIARAASRRNRRATKTAPLRSAARIKAKSFTIDGEA
jgi:hypothetical protein